MSNLGDIQAVINAHENRAQEAFEELQSIVSGLSSGGSVIPGKVSLPSLVEAPEYVPDLTPDLDIVNNYSVEFERLHALLSDWLRGLRDSFLELFYPEVSQLLAAETDDWLLEVIRDGTLGIPATAQNALFERARERTLKELARVKAEAIGAWASMGYTLPSTVLVDQLAKADQAAQNAIGETNRDVFIKAVDAQLDMVKFAVDKAVTLRNALIVAMNDYLRSFAIAPTAAADVATRRSDAKKTLWDVSVRYFSALVDFKRVEAEINIARARATADQARIDVDALQANLQRHLSATEAAAQTYGNLVAAAMSGLNSIVTNAHQSNEDV